MPQDKTPSKNDLAWDNRILCSDENCIGIIGHDGKCKECGKIFDGNLPEDFGGSGDPEPAEPTLKNYSSDNLLESEEDTSDNDPETDDDSEPDKLDPDWEQRILCSDESCIGVIDSTGRCKECGKPYEKND